MSPATSNACPEHRELLALAEGCLSDRDAAELTDHLDSCDACSERLDRIEDQSDTLIRALTALPVSEHDEETYQSLRAELLAAPQAFTGATDVGATQSGDSGAAVGNSVDGVALELPYQLGNYELLEQIGAGAFGAVFRARHCRLEREVAVKLLLRVAGPLVADFLNEMRSVGKLDHPHIIRATDAGEHEGMYFLVMEFVQGLDVSSLMRRVGQLSIADACEIARQTAVGLSAAHAHTLVHRDVKTSNLLFTSEGQIKLLDLGLATVSSTAPPSTTSHSGPRGTADYMAPEQWLESDRVTAQADIYSLGCTLYKLLVGQPPFREVGLAGGEKQRAHCETDPPAASQLRRDVPAGLDQLLKRMLAKRPEDRPKSAQEVASALQRHARHHGLPAIARTLFPGSKATRTASQVSPSRWSRSFTTLVLLAAFCLIATLITQVGPSLWQAAPTGIQVDQWRELQVMPPATLAVRDGADPQLLRGEESVRLVSQAAALLHLGTPVVKPFSWRAELRRDDWTQDAGLFFRLRRRPGEKRELEFHTMQIVLDEPDQARALWAFYFTQDGTLQQQVLAETVLDGFDAEQPQRFELTLGTDGFPQLRLNGRLTSRSQWTPSQEARSLIVTKKEQLPAAFAGRIGVFHAAGETECRQPMLTYLTP